MSIDRRLGYLPIVATLTISALVSLPVTAAGLPNGYHRYGCCLVNKDNPVAQWEFEDDVPYADCYRSAQLIGNPLESLRHRQFAFYKGQRCAEVSGRPANQELVPIPWDMHYRTGS